MDSAFPRSLVLLGDLASSIQEPKPSGCGQDYVDQGLAIIITAFEKHRTFQETYISREFQMQRDYIDSRLKEVNDQLKEIDHKFEDVYKRLEAVDGRLGHLEHELKRQREHTDSQFNAIEGSMDQSRAMTLNSKVDRGIKILQPVAAYRNGAYCLPDNFPKTVAEFWKLRKHTKLPQLTSLSLFYNVTREELIEPDIDDSDGEEQQVPYASVSLPRLIEKFPEMAHMALADRFGLKYGKISAFMQRLEDFRQTATGKRAQVEESPKDISKFFRTENETRAPPAKPNTQSTVPLYPRFSANEVVPLEFLLKSAKSTTTESTAYSDRTRLGWAETSARQRVNEIIAEERRQLEKKLASEKEGEHDVSRPYRTVAALRVPDSVSSKQSGDTEPISIPTVILEAEER
ncbi:hypothetical protein DIZ76_013889 [Coccidioides immitis]|nr:hypothetical protein DIZ76_013889 [Coccidioides immitis]